METGHIEKSETSTKKFCNPNGKKVSLFELIEEITVKQDLIWRIRYCILKQFADGATG